MSFFVPAGTEASAIYEEEFALVYNVPGITYGDVEGMPPWERKAFLELLLKQRNIEKEQHEKAKGNVSGKPADGFTSGRNDLMRPSMKGEAYGAKDPRDRIRGGQPAKFVPGPGTGPPKRTSTVKTEKGPSQAS